MNTTGVFKYRHPEGQEPRTDTKALEAAAALEPILQRWRHRCSAGLIDANGKIRNVFRRDVDGADNVSLLIEEISRIPEAVAELEAALEARRELESLSGAWIELPVLDARRLATTSLHDNGFQLVRHESRVTDWDDDRQLRDIYYQEICDLVCNVTGATHAFSNNHLRRQSEPPVGGDGPLAELMSQSRGPVNGAHNDFTESYGEGIVRTVANGGIPHTQTFGLTDAMLAAGVTEAELRNSRMLVINTWRAVTEVPLRRYPLAVADRNSIPRESLGTSLIGKVPCGEPRGGIDIYSARHDARHHGITTQG